MTVPNEGRVMSKISWKRDAATGEYTSSCGRFRCIELTCSYSRHGSWVLTDTARLNHNPQYGHYTERKHTLASCKSAAERFARNHTA